jgi:hypothetical protein
MIPLRKSFWSIQNRDWRNLQPKSDSLVLSLALSLVRYVLGIQTRDPGVIDSTVVPKTSFPDENDATSKSS